VFGPGQPETPYAPLKDVRPPPSDRLDPPILAAMAGLALAGCSHPANNTDNTTDSSASAASDSSAMATPAAPT